MKGYEWGPSSGHCTGVVAEKKEESKRVRGSAVAAHALKHSVEGHRGGRTQEVFRR